MKAKLVLTFLLGATSMAAFAQPEDAQLRRDLRDHYARADRLMAARNIPGLMKMTHGSFVSVNKQGRRMSRNEHQEWLRGLRGTKTVLKHVRTQGSEEAVSWIEVVLTRMQNRGGRWVAMKSTHRYSETLKMTSAGWKATYRQELPTDEPWSFKTGG